MQNKNIHIDYFLQDLNGYEAPVSGSLKTSFAATIARAASAGSPICEKER
jgi:hypothetical protein